MPEVLRVPDPAVLSGLSSLNLVARTVVEGFITGLHRSLHKGSSVEFSEHREYRPGDDPRYLDWKVFSRTDRLAIKDFREETNLKAYLLLDVSNSMNYRSGTVSKLQYAVFVAASLAYLMLRQKDAVGLVVFDSDVRSFIKPAAAPGQFRRLTGELERVRPGAETSLYRVLNTVAGHIRRRGLIILISDLLDEPEQVLRGLAHFRHKHHEVIVFHVLDPAETGFPFGGAHEFVDMETNERISADALSVRETYRRVFGEFLGWYEKNCADRNIEYARSTTDCPFDRFLLQYLNRRAKYL